MLLNMLTYICIWFSFRISLSAALNLGVIIAVDEPDHSPAYNCDMVNRATPSSNQRSTAALNQTTIIPSTEPYSPKQNKVMPSSNQPPNAALNHTTTVPSTEPYSPKQNRAMPSSNQPPNAALNQTTTVPSTEPYTPKQNRAMPSSNQPPNAALNQTTTVPSTEPYSPKQNRAMPSSSQPPNAALNQTTTVPSTEPYSPKQNRAMPSSSQPPNAALNQTTTVPSTEPYSPKQNRAMPSSNQPPNAALNQTTTVPSTEPYTPKQNRAMPSSNQPPNAALNQTTTVPSTEPYSPKQSRAMPSSNQGLNAALNQTTTIPSTEPYSPKQNFTKLTTMFSTMSAVSDQTEYPANVINSLNVTRTTHMKDSRTTFTVSISVTSKSVEDNQLKIWIPIVAVLAPTVFIFIVIVVICCIVKRCLTSEQIPAVAVSESYSISGEDQSRPNHPAIANPTSGSTVRKSFTLHNEVDGETARTVKDHDTQKQTYKTPKSFSTTLDIGPDSSSIKSISSFLDKAKNVEVTAKPYHDTSTLETISTETAEGEVACMNPRAIEYVSSGDDRNNVKDWPIQLMKHILRMKRKQRQKY